MEKRIILIALAVFSIAIILAQNNIEKVYALTIRTSSAISANSLLLNTTSDGYNYYFDDTNNKFGKVKISDGSLVFESNVSSNQTRGFKCSSSFCWHLTDNTASSGILTRYSGATGSLAQSYTTNAVVSGSSDIGIFGNTVFIGKKCTTGEIGSSGSGDTDYAVFSIDGLNMVGTLAQHTDCGANFNPISQASQGILGFQKNAQSGGANNNLVVIVNGAGGTADFSKVISLNTILSSTVNTEVCSVQFPTGGNAFVSFRGNAMQNNGLYSYFGMTDSSNTADIRIERVLTTNCGLANYVYTAVQTASTFTGMNIVDSNNAIYLAYRAPSSGNFRISEYSFSSDVPSTTVKNFDIVLTATPQGVNYYSVSNIVITSISNALVYIELGGAGTGSGGTGGIDCTNPANVNILTCRLDSIGGGQLGSFSDLVGETFGNSTNNIFVQLGLVEAGSDIKTNGVGYGLTLVGLGIMIAMFALASGMALNRIPTFVWFLGTLAVIGISTGFGFVDPLWLIISILVIIALASAKILSTLEIGGFR